MAIHSLSLWHYFPHTYTIFFFQLHVYVPISFPVAGFFSTLLSFESLILKRHEGWTRTLVSKNSNDANPYLSFEWQPQNLIVHTSVCHSSPSGWCGRRCVCRYSTDGSCAASTLDTAVSLFRHHLRLFCLRYQKSVVFIFFYFPIPNYSILCFFFSLSPLCVSHSQFLFGLLFGLKERVKTKPSALWHKENVVDIECNNTVALLILFFVLVEKTFNHLYTQFGLSTGCFSLR